MKQSTTIYNYVLSVIDGMQIGDSIEIDIPDNLIAFRKYLSEISKRYNERYTTKVINDKLRIMRIKNFSIFTKELQ